MTATILLALTLAQTPSPRTVSPADIQRAAATLRLLQVARTGQLNDPAMAKAVRDFMQANPDFDPGSLKGLLRDTPGAAIEPELRNQAVEIAKQFATEQAALQLGARPGDGNTPPPPPQPPVQEPARRPNPDEANQPDPAQPSNLDPESPSPARPDPQGVPPTARNSPPDDRGGETIRWWEQNVGPLDKTPAFEGVVREFLKGVDPKSSERGPLGKLLSGATGRQAGEWAGALAEALGGFKSNAAGAAANMPETPELALPSTPSTAGLSRIGLVVVAIGVCLAAALFWRRVGFTPGVVNAGLGRATAPRPSMVRDRESLVAAVDQLGRHLLGPDALPLHHRALEAALNRRGPAGAVGELIALYEAARYAPQGDEFPVDRLPAARSALASVLDAWR